MEPNYDIKYCAWMHVADKSHVHISSSPTEPPLLEGDCAVKSIYYDELATKVIQPLMDIDPKKAIEALKQAIDDPAT